MNYIIYKLIDPNTNKIRYIGKTKNLQKRYYHHCSLAACNKEDTHRSNWIKSLLLDKQKPIIEVIEFCNEYNWQEREIYWIKYYSDKYDLCNHTIGGDGGKGFPRYKKFKIYQFDKTGKLINSFNSTKEASILTNTPFEGIKKCIRGHYKTSNKYHWSKDKTFQWKKRNHNAKQVLQYSLDNKFIKKFDSITKASVITKIQRNSIKNCCLNKPHCISAGGYKWKYNN